MIVKISPSEYYLMKNYIEEHCGIHLEKDKEYLIESRLASILEETGSRSFQEFLYKAKADQTGRLRDRIIDAMTTNETSWFRDANLWEYIREVVIPDLIRIAVQKGRVNIWSAAVSTGQEIYSFLMLLDEALKERRMYSVMDRFEILGTDISSSALFTAISGCYDAISIRRGLPEDKLENYFSRNGNIWELTPDIRNRVRFQRFNLQNGFQSMGPFNLILCRYVSIYFSESFKRELFRKMATVLAPGGIMLLGATESLREFSIDFDISYHKTVVINRKKDPSGAVV